MDSPLKMVVADGDDLPERWEAFENGHGDSDPIRFELYWVPLSQAHVIGAGQAAFIGRIQEDRA